MTVNAIIPFHISRAYGLCSVKEFGTAFLHFEFKGNVNDYI